MVFQSITWHRFTRCCNLPSIIFFIYSAIFTGTLIALFVVQAIRPDLRPWVGHEQLLLPPFPCENKTEGNNLVHQPISTVASTFFFITGFYMICSMVSDYNNNNSSSARTLTVNFNSDSDDDEDTENNNDNDVDFGFGRDSQVDQNVSVSYESNLFIEEALSPVISHPSVSGVFGLLCTYLGVGTFFYHSCACDVGERIAVSSIIAIFPFLISVQIFSFFPKWGTINSHWILLPINLIWFVVSLGWVEVWKLIPNITTLPFQVIYFTLTILISISSIIFHFSRRKITLLHVEFLLVAFFCILCSFVVWIFEESIQREWVPSQFCISPIRAFQYFFSAAALMSYYFYFRSISFSRIIDAILWRKEAGFQKFAKEEHLMRPLMTEDDPEQFHFEL